MKDATLWKRILNQSLLTPAGFQKEAMVNDIIRAPNIVDFRPLEYRGRVAPSCFNNLSFPFPKFWIEGRGLARIKFGLYLIVENPATDAFVRAFVVASIDNLPPELLGKGTFYCKPGESPRDVRMSAVKTFIEDNGEDHAEAILMLATTSLWDSLEMLGCKNVGLAAKAQDPKECRRATKRHGPNPNGYRYHVLTVRPAGSKPGTPGVEIGTMPRHVCRGHFSEYGPEFGKGLLFGKHAGRFFVPPHLKGKKENGTVEKDYRVA